MTDDWLGRIGGAIERDGRSKRAISKAAGLGVNFVTELLKGEKTPGIDSIARLCAELNVSLPWVLTGVDMTPDAVEMLSILSRLSSDQQSAILELARQLQAAAPPPAKPRD